MLVFRAVLEYLQRPSQHKLGGGLGQDSMCLEVDVDACRGVCILQHSVSGMWFRRYLFATEGDCGSIPANYIADVLAKYDGQSAVNINRPLQHFFALLEWLHV